MTEQPVSTAEYSDPGDPLPPAAIESRTVVMLIGGFSAVLIATLAALLPVKYAVLHPGPVLNTLGEVKVKGKATPLISISGRKTYPTSGQLDLTTVSVVGGPNRPITLVQVITGWLDRTAAVVPQEQVFTPGQTQQQSDAENQAEMVSSQESATAAALATLGIAVPTKLSVAGVAPTAPASKLLKDGDVIRSVNGQKITDLQKLRTLLEATKAGAEVEMSIQRKGVDRTLTVATIASPEDGRTVLGVYLDPTFSFPFSVKIQIEDIGGPSAGTMFALGIIDTLTEGDLTGGKKIAGTGTIDADGLVGPIGGIRQKLVGARNAGARYFLAPADNCDEVVKHVPDGLTVVKIDTLDHAEDAVKAIAAGKVSTLAGC